MVNPRFLSHTLGTGPIVIDLWLDYICPFSKKQFDSIYKSVFSQAEQKYPKQFTFVFQHVPQPWHGQGSYLHEAGIAVGLIAPEKFWDFSDKLFERSIEFYDVKSYNKSRKQINEELADIAAGVGVDRNEFLRLTTIDLNGEAQNPGPKVVNDLKYFVKIGRQNSVHVTPTVFVNGLADPEISSSWTTEQWLEKLGKVADAVTEKL